MADLPPMPYWAMPLLQVFSELDALRGSNGFGMNPISLDMIWQWERANRVRLTTWERNTIHALDLVRLETAYGNRS